MCTRIPGRLFDWLYESYLAEPPWIRPDGSVRARPVPAFYARLDTAFGTSRRDFVVPPVAKFVQGVTLALDADAMATAMRCDRIVLPGMELLEGETLAHRLERGSLPVAEVVTLGRQIADALDRAHRAGVVHRDLKPGNIMLTRSGAKLLDFGLARATGLGPSPGDLSRSPTMSRQLTAEGTIVVTFQYLAPETVEGHEADARSDIFAFGAILYEMATGARAFEGATKASLIVAILEKHPPMLGETRGANESSARELRSLATIEHVVRQCIEKDPERRWQSALSTS